MALLQRARASGRCPPSLLAENRMPPGDGFEAAVTKVLDVQGGLSLTTHGQVASDFSAVMKMAEQGTGGASNEVLEFRRCIILAIVGSTNTASPSLKAVLDNGYLSAVKVWYDQILQGAVGGVDLLLHLLSNIVDLPVTKLLVKQSGMGKAIGSIEKHSICAGTPNQSAIMERVHKIKGAWNASVKARKDKVPAASPKRQIDGTGILSVAPSPAKKAKVEEKKKTNAFSSLLKKVTDSTPTKVPASASNTPLRTPSKSGVLNDTPRSRKAKRVKWADHFGGNLSASRVLDSTASPSPADPAKVVDDSKVSWTDRKKRDRLKEKELLAKAKKAKLMDDDNDIETVSRIKPTMSWRVPALLPENPDVAQAQLVSKQMEVQTEREKKVQRVRYMSEDQVPASPAPLSDVEQALDMTSVASAVVASIPFFVPQASAPAPAVPPSPAAIPTPYSHPPSHVPALPSAPPPAAYNPQPQSAHESATAQTVQSLGLPMFLVGQNVQALQTLASSPSLLSTLVDPNGMYDQPRLMSLVQTLSQNVAPPQPPPGGQIGGLPGYQPPAPAPAPPSYGSQSYQPSSGGGIYGPASASSSTSPYGPASGSSFGGGGGFPGGGPRNGGYRGDSNSDGNLHVSGYGPSATQSDIITLFAPFVKVDEVVMKGTFSFVNTSDPMGAQQARETLNGAMLCGMPIRINMAQRRGRDPSFPGGGGPAGPGGGGNFGGGGPRGGPDMPKPPGMGHRNDMPPFQQKPPPFDQGGPPQEVRDDRGNPATKNLFVAGYGPGTTEVQLREVFGQYATIVGVVTKGTFSFVNTSDKYAAVRAREALSSSVINGGVLRINFAKETGRLGTSFDLTYGPGSGGPGGGGGGGGGGGSHYGRGGF